MESKPYAKMCQQCSMLKGGIQGTKEDVPDKLKVKYNGTEYYPVSYELIFEKGHPVHLGILHDLKVNSTIRVRLEKVIEVE